jgi:hypothetical protein
MFFLKEAKGRKGEERRGKNDFQTAYVFMALHLTTPIHQEGSS